MRTITLRHPRKLMIGLGCSQQVVEDIAQQGLSRVFIITSEPIADLALPIVTGLSEAGIASEVYAGINAEPSVSAFECALDAARAFEPDAFIGFGGGSPMDTAKVVAALHIGTQSLADVFGIEALEGRSTYLALIPTTSGTGSEVTPYAIFHDEAEQLKKGVVSSHIVPDASYVDAALTVTMPPAVTASTGMDAMTHCIEAYVNKYHHPLVDSYALQGIQLISANLRQAVRDGNDMEAREAMSFGSVYGGMVLGPVNTGAVHALAYPLGGEFHIAHGVSNSVLLPSVAAFNLSATPERYSDIAMAMGVEPASSVVETAQSGIQRMIELSRECGIPSGMGELGVPEDAIPRMAESAMKVTRLLSLNPREVTVKDAEAIYRNAY